MRKILVGMMAVMGGAAAVGVFGGADGAVVATTAWAPATTGAAMQVKVDPEAAKAIEAAMILPVGQARFKGAAEASQDWVKRDPVAVYEWTLQHPPGVFRHQFLNIMVGQWVHNDAKGAVDYITTRSDKAGWGSLAGNWCVQDSAAATAWADKQAKEMWPVIYGAMGEAWARNDGPAATAWVASLPVEKGRYAYPLTAATYAWNDPKVAAAWAEKLPECDERSVAFGMVANVWSRKIPGDVEKIKTWVGQLSVPDAGKEKILKQIVMPKEKKAGG